MSFVCADYEIIYLYLVVFEKDVVIIRNTMNKIYLQVIKNVNVLWCIYVSVSTLKMKFVYTKLLLFTRGSNFYYCWLIIYGVTCCMFVGFCESVSIDLVESFSFDAIRPRNGGVSSDGVLAVVLQVHNAAN